MIMLHEKTTKLKVLQGVQEQHLEGELQTKSLTQPGLNFCFGRLSEKSFEGAAAEAEGGAGEGASA